MKTYLFTMVQLTQLLVRRYFRSRTAIFFSIFFPLLLLFVFGELYGSNNDTSFKVAVFNQSHTPLAQRLEKQLNSMKVLKVQDITDQHTATERMGRSEIDATITIPPAFGQKNSQGYPAGTVQVRYSQNNTQGGQAVQSIVQGVLNGQNIAITKIQPPLTVEGASTAQKGLTGFDYAFAGLLGFSILGMGVFGPINMLPAEKKSGALTRLRVTPLRPSQFILAYMLSALITGSLSIIAMFLVAIQFFHFHMQGSYLVFIPYALFGAIMIFGIGVGVGGWAKNERQAAPLGQGVAFPLMFLSGVFIPRFIFPEWLQHVTAYVPMTPIVDGMRMILTEGKSLVDLGSQLGIMTLWTVVIYLVAFRIFRWD